MPPVMSEWPRGGTPQGTRCEKGKGLPRGWKGRTPPGMTRSPSSMRRGRSRWPPPGLAEPAKKALATLDREWDGLAAHRDYPTVSLDNNTAERMIRGPVVTRKNAGGSRNDESARLAAVIWTITATIQIAGLNVLTLLTAYLNEFGRHGVKPLTGPALERFLLINTSPQNTPTSS